MWDYNEKVKEYFLNPRNAGEIKDPDAVGEAGSLACGDHLKLMLKIDKQTEVITDAKFQTFGCGSAIASASALTEMIIGKTIAEAEKITNKDIVDFLGGLPVEKMHCSVMGQEALEAAINQYRGKSPEPLEERKRHIVCECFGVTDAEIMRVVRDNNLTTVEDVTHYTKAGGGCMSCHDKIRQLIAQVRGEAEKAPPARHERRKLTNIQKMRLIEETFEKEIRPMLRADGGDIELIDIEGDRVLVSLRGMCSSCMSASFTLKKYVEPKLREFVSPDLVIEEVKP
ncbi:MAG: Fe-S cluster assembly protein NifU [Desulfobacterota bacterium]|nr:Fe-S cluster assembly protein NifU [Thermodesulfobacteriota bacterium]